MQPQHDFGRYERLLRSLSSRFCRRCHSAGAVSVSVDDVFQEACIAYCKARDSWKPEFVCNDGTIKRVPFAAYLARGVRDHINGWINKEVSENLNRLHLDATGADDGDDLHGFVPDANTVDPEACSIEASCRRRASRALSEDAQTFLRLLENPHPALFKAIAAQGDRRRFALERGVVTGAPPKHITSSIVFELMGCNRTQRSRILSELRQFASKQTA